MIFRSCRGGLASWGGKWLNWLRRQPTSLQGRRAPPHPFLSLRKPVHLSPSQTPHPQPQAQAQTQPHPYPHSHRATSLKHQATSRTAPQPPGSPPPPASPPARPWHHRGRARLQGRACLIPQGITHLHPRARSRPRTLRRRHSLLLRVLARFLSPDSRVELEVAPGLGLELDSGSVGWGSPCRIRLAGPRSLLLQRLARYPVRCPRQRERWRAAPRLKDVLRCPGLVVVGIVRGV